MEHNDFERPIVAGVVVVVAAAAVEEIAVLEVIGDGEGVVVDSVVVVAAAAVDATFADCFSRYLLRCLTNRTDHRCPSSPHHC